MSVESDSQAVERPTQTADSEEEGKNTRELRKHNPADSEDISCHIYCLPDEILLKICSYLKAKDLCVLSRVSRRVHGIADDRHLWKTIYQAVFEYDVPLFNPAPFVFQFVQPEDSQYANLWKRSYRQLLHGYHVSARQNRSDALSSHVFFRSIKEALAHNKSVPLPNKIPIIFVHSGVHKTPPITIDQNVVLIGASGGNVEENVIIENDFRNLEADRQSLLRIESYAYFGHLTLRASSAVYHLTNLLLITPTSYSWDDPSIGPIIEHCQFLGITEGDWLGINALGPARPTIRNCTVRDCNVGINLNFIRHGNIEENVICGNQYGIRSLVNYYVFSHLPRWSPHHTNTFFPLCLRRNNIWGNEHGIFLEVGEDELTKNIYIKENKIHDNVRQIEIEGTKGIVINGNQISGGRVGLALSNRGLAVPTKAVVAANDFSGNEIDVRADDQSHAYLERNVFTAPRLVVKSKECKTAAIEGNICRGPFEIRNILINNTLE